MRVSPVGASSRRSLMNAFRMGRLQCCSSALSIGTWNIEGLSDIKLVELEQHMHDLGIQQWNFTILSPGGSYPGSSMEIRCAYECLHGLGILENIGALEPRAT